MEDGEPYPKIKLEQLPLEGNEDEKVKIKVNASVEKKGKTKKIEKIELIKEGTVLTERTYDNLEVEDIFEIETNGIYTFKATTDQAKSRSKKIEINIEETDSTIEIDHDIKTPRNTTEIGSKNGIETGPIQVTIKYEENGFKRQYKKETDEEWTNVENDIQVSFQVTENTTILARYFDGTNGFQIKRYKIENVDNEGPIIESKNITFENKNINITASATDVSGILRYEYSIDGENYSTTNNFPITAGGTYKVYVKAIDNAGNETIYSEEIIANDYTLSRTAQAGGTVSGDSGKKFENESCTVNATPNTGYSFLGWYEGATRVSTSATYTFKMPSKNYSIVARFNSIVYTITYNANGGSGAPSQQTKSHGYDITLSSTIPTKSGYEFLGWSTSSTATTATYSSGQRFSVNANTTLYAVWKKTYTITYDANGGSGSMTAGKKSDGSGYIIQSNAFTAPSGYIFKGWATSSSSHTVAYSAGSSYTTNSDLTLYAIWYCDGKNCSLYYICQSTSYRKVATSQDGVSSGNVICTVCGAIKGTWDQHGMVDTSTICGNRTHSNRGAHPETEHCDHLKTSEHYYK